MVGGDHLQIVLCEALPELFLVPFLAQRRSENIFGGFKAGHIHVFQRKIKVLRAGFGIGAQSAVARLADFFERVVAREVHDINRRAGHFRQSDGSRRRFRFGGRRPGERVIFRRAFAFRERALHDYVNRSAVFRVHADHSSAVRRGGHGAKNRRVVQHETHQQVRN